MRIVEPEGVGYANDEVAHRLWIHQGFAVVRLAEPRRVDGQQVRVGGEVLPSGLKGIHALGPRAQQNRILIAVATLSETHRKSIDRRELGTNQITHCHSLARRQKPSAPLWTGASGSTHGDPRITLTAEQTPDSCFRRPLIRRHSRSRNALTSAAAAGYRADQFRDRYQGSPILHR